MILGQIAEILLPLSFAFFAYFTLKRMNLHKEMIDMTKDRIDSKLESELITQNNILDFATEVQTKIEEMESRIKELERRIL